MSRGGGAAGARTAGRLLRRRALVIVGGGGFGGGGADSAGAAAEAGAGSRAEAARSAAAAPPGAGERHEDEGVPRASSTTNASWRPSRPRRALAGRGARARVAKAVDGRGQAAARAQFEKLEHDEDGQRNGVLIFVAPASQNFAVIGDEGIHESAGRSSGGRGGGHGGGLPCRSLHGRDREGRGPGGRRARHALPAHGRHRGPERARGRGHGGLDGILRDQAPLHGTRRRASVAAPPRRAQCPRSPLDENAASALVPGSKRYQACLARPELRLLAQRLARRPQHHGPASAINPRSSRDGVVTQRISPSVRPRSGREAAPPSTSRPAGVAPAHSRASCADGRRWRLSSIIRS